MKKAWSWLTDPTASGRKRGIAAACAVLAGAIKGAGPVLATVCATGALGGAACSIDPGPIAAGLDVMAHVLNDLVAPGAELTSVLVGAWGLWAARGKKAVQG